MYKNYDLNTECSVAGVLTWVMSFLWDVMIKKRRINMCMIINRYVAARWAGIAQSL